MMGQGQRFPIPIARWAREVLLPGLLLCAGSVFAAAPYAHTQPVTLITAASATLNGTTVPNGSPSLAWFEWGARGGFGQTSSPVDVGSGSTIVQVSAAISGFTNRKQFQCRLVVSNSSGISYGKMVLFTTGAKVLAWGINAGGRGAAILSPVGPVLDPSGRIIFAPAANQFGSPLANFDFKANDGQMDSPPASVAINIVLPPAPQLNAAKSGSTAIAPPNLTVGGPSVAGSGGFSLRFAGHSNLIYSVWASTNLLHWLPEGTASPITNGWLQFVDTDSPNWPLRFYRISIPNTRAYELNFSGHSNASYRVWASTNLVDWEVLGIATVTSNGWFNFLDVDAAKWPKRFYRAGAP